MNGMNSKNEIAGNGDDVSILTDFPELIRDPVKDQFTKGVCLLAFPLLLCLLFVVIPVVFSLVLSFFNYSGFGPFKAVGFYNYASLFTDNNFLHSLLENLAYTLNPLKYIVVLGIPFLFAFFISRLPLKPAWVFNIIMKMAVFAASLFSASMIIFIYYIIFFRAVRPDEFVYTTSIMLADMFFSLALALCFGSLFFQGLFNAQGLSKGKKTYAPFLQGGLVLILLSAVYTLQLFTPLYVLKGGITQFPVNTIIGYLYCIAMRSVQLGKGSALAFILQLVFIGCGILLYFIFEKRDFVLWIKDRTAGKKLMPGHRSNKTMAGYAGVSIILVIVMLVMFIPCFQFFSIAFQPQQSFFEGIINLFPFNFTFENFTSLFANHSIYPRSIAATWSYVIFLALFQTIISLAAGYALGRYRFPGQKAIIFIVYAVFFISPALLIIPYFFFNRILRLIDSFFIFLPLLFSPAGIIMFRIFFEGTRIDHARISKTANREEQLPLKDKINLNTIRMTLFALVVFLVSNINEFILPLVNIFKRENQAAALFLTFIRNEGQAYSGSASAGNLLAYFPLQLICFIILILLQKHFLSGFVLFQRKEITGKNNNDD